MASRQWRSDDTDTWLYGFGNGSDGDLTISADTTEAPIDASCSGTSGTTSLSATNASFAAGQLILIHQTRGTGAGGWELNKIASYTAGTITTTHALTMTYTDSGASQAQVRVMKQYNSVTIDSTKTYTAKAWNGDVGGILGWFAKTGTTVTGSLNLTGNQGSGATGGSGKGFSGGSTANGVGGTAGSGEGTAGASTATTGANGSGGGGGAVSSGTASGGGGGNGTAGGNATADSGTPGTGGSAVGTASLVTMDLGGGGGGGRRDYSTSTGGAGGGAICAIFSKDITITGSINLNGANGVNATGGAGGGGAGGSCLLKCATGTLGTNLITASGGGYGSSEKPSHGGAGGVGRIHIDYSGSYTGTTTPTIDATNDTTIVQPLAAGGAFLYNFI